MSVIADGSIDLDLDLVLDLDLDLRVGEAHTPGSHAGRVILYRATQRAPLTVRDTICRRSTRRMPRPSPIT